MRWLVVVLVVVSPAAHAAPRTLDLAGLVMSSDAVIEAEAVANAGVMTTYRTVRVLRGTAPAELEVNDSGYHFDPGFERRVLFLHRMSRGLVLVESGLRAVKANRVYRFTRNTGALAAQPQGSDPETHWRSDAGQLDVDELVAAIEAASRRVAAVRAAARLADPGQRRAAMVAAFPPPGPGTADVGYLDLLSEEAQRLLVVAGDLEGALAVAERDRTPERWSALAPLARLYALAADRTRPLHLRTTAIQKSVLMTGEADLRALAALVEDPLPQIRIAAIDALVRIGIRISSSNADVALVRDTLVARYRREQDNDVLALIADTLQRRKLAPLPPHPRRVAVRTTTYALVACLGTTFTASALRAIAVRGGYEVALRDKPLYLQECGVTVTTQAATTPAPPGVYTLVLTLSNGADAVTVPLGTARVTAEGRVGMR